MAYTSQLILLSAGLCLLASVHCSKEEKALFDFLFSSYNRGVRPVASPSEAVNVSVEFTPVYIEEVSKEGGFSQIYGWLSMTWNDSQLSWDPIDFGLIDNFAVCSDKVWKPDIRLYNGKMETEKVKVVLMQNGIVTWVVPALFHFLCDFKVGYPVGKMSCSGKFGSWAQTGAQISLSKRSVDASHYKEKFGWSISNTGILKNVKKYVCCEQSYEDIVVTLEFQKKVKNCGI